MEGHKICKSCPGEQPYINFYPHKNSNDGHRHTCKKCFGKKSNIIHSHTKQHCARDTGRMIRVSNCYPGCNDVCKACPHPNEKNRVGGNLTKEEEDDLRRDRNTQSGYGVAYGNWDK